MVRGQSRGRVTEAGSQRYLQDLVNRDPRYLNRLIRSSSHTFAGYGEKTPRWVSPLVYDNYQEYRDDDFLRRIGFSHLRKDLHHFWPGGGPRWDALGTVEGRDGSRGVLLAEAKAHTMELGGWLSECQATSPRSRAKIKNAFEAVKRALAVPAEADWMGPYYQYANRLAHLYFLHVLCGVPTWMVFIYFVGGWKRHHVSEVAEWTESLSRIPEVLRLPNDHILSERIVNVFPLVKRRPSRNWRR